MKTRAKFTLLEKTEFKATQSEMGYKLKFTAVSGGSEENEKFFKWTPSASIEMATVNAEAAKQFVPGQQYYVDFSLAEAEA
jgi:hypothetical protein